MKSTLKRNVVAYLAGVLFAVGLIVGGMTQPGKVIAFLDLAGGWDPSLAFVLGGALSIYAVGLRFTLRRDAPILGKDFLFATRRDLTPRLFLGAALFGVGWAAAGFCPGPAMVSFGAVTTEALLFFPAFTFGSLLVGWYDRAALRRLHDGKTSEPAPQGELVCG